MKLLSYRYSAAGRLQRWLLRKRREQIERAICRAEEDLDARREGVLALRDEAAWMNIVLAYMEEP